MTVRGEDRISRLGVECYRVACSLEQRFPLWARFMITDDILPELEQTLSQ